MASPVEAMRAIVTVRWPLLESYALARQDGLAEPVGLVIDREHAYARELASQLLVGQNPEGAPGRSVSCMERGALAGMLAVAAPELARLLRGAADEPGRWIAVLLAQQGWLLTGTWQELMMAEERAASERGRSRAR
jgi:hypothetical protein